MRPSSKTIEHQNPKFGRRLVVGTDELGKSVVISDGDVPEKARWSKPGKSTGSDLWLINEIPASLAEQSDTLVGYEVENNPPENGIITRIIKWEPGFSYPMHSTNSIDLVFIISGQIELVLETGSEVLDQGDSVVQLGTVHGWKVLGDKPCILALVLVSAKRN